MRSVIFSIYIDGLSHEIIAKQRAVVHKFLPAGTDFLQIPAQSHADGINQFLTHTNYDIYITLDIDCIPLNSFIFPDMITKAQKCLVGCAQKANHISNNNHIFVGPCGMAFSRNIYERIGKPSFEPTARGDVGEEMTYQCQANNIPVSFLWPTHVVHDRWDLAYGLRLGVGTTYENSLFHAFEIRSGQSIPIFLNKCDEVLSS